MKIGSVACFFVKIRGDAVGNNAMVHLDLSRFGGFPCRLDWFCPERSPRLLPASTGSSLCKYSYVSTPQMHAKLTAAQIFQCIKITHVNCNQFVGRFELSSHWHLVSASHHFLHISAWWVNSQNNTQASKRSSFPALCNAQIACLSIWASLGQNKIIGTLNEASVLFRLRKGKESKAQFLKDCFKLCI